MACGGEDQGRPVGDSNRLPKDEQPQNCKAEALLPLADARAALTDAQKAQLGLRDLLPMGDFKTGANGWATSTDSSPQPPTAARPIKSTCPRDSKFDCCTYSAYNDEWRTYEALTPDQLAQVKAGQADDLLTQAEVAQVELEKELQKSYKCAPLPDPVPPDFFCPALGSSLSAQLVEKPSACAKDKEYWTGTGFFGLGSCQPLASACDLAQPAGSALHIRGARFTDWGAQIYRSTLDPASPSATRPFDASKYDGISFWVRLGQGGTQPVGKSMFVVFDDELTKENQLKFKLNVNEFTGDSFKLKYADAEGTYALDDNDYLRDINGKCARDAKGNAVLNFVKDELGNYVLDSNGNKVLYERDSHGNKILDYALDPNTGAKIPEWTAYSTPDNMVQANNCYDVSVDVLKCDRFGAGVGLEPEWRFVKVPFANMRQRGYGVVSPAGRLLTESLLAFGIYLDVGNWDFWIDNVAYYSDPKSAAPEQCAP
jgi:hypothetical protein